MHKEKTNSNKKTDNHTIPKIIINDFERTKHGHKLCIAQCPYCYNFFKVREDYLKSGHTKSCGCLKSLTTPNKYYFPPECNYGIGFYTNTNGFFLFSLKDFEKIKKYHWTDRNDKGRHEPITCIDGKTTSMARFLLDTPPDLEAEHINGIPNDNRRENIRNATTKENSQNKSSTKNSNEELYGDFTYEKSQEIAKKIETPEFKNPFYFTGTLAEINDLPANNVFKIWLRSIIRYYLKGCLPEDYEIVLFIRLMNAYLKDKAERKAA